MTSSRSFLANRTVFSRSLANDLDFQVDRYLVTDHFTKKEIIMAGMGWGRLHEHLISKELDAGQPVPLTIRNYQSKLDINICIARMICKPVGPVAESLWQEFSEEH